MKKILYTAISAMLFSIPASSLADSQRFASITHIDSNYINQGICAYLFKVDNGAGAMGSAFNNLEISLRANDLFGNQISKHTLEAEAFGDSNATRTTFALLETECINDLHEFEITEIMEAQPNGRMLELPRYIFKAENPKLARMSIQSEPGADTIHRNFIGTWVTDKTLCSNPEINDDSQYIIRIAGDTVRLNGWMLTYTESYPGLNAGDNEDFNTPEAFGGMANFFQFSPDYSQTYGRRESGYRLNDGKLYIGEGALEFTSCN